MNDSDIKSCELLLWDTKFFGFRIGRVCGDTLTSEKIKKIDLWRRQFQVRCLYFLARLDDPPTIQLAEANGFHFVDVRMTFEWHKPEKLNPIKPLRLRASRKEDIPVLSNIARHLYDDTRYFFDDQFPKHLSEALYETWITHSIEGYANKVLVAESDKGLPVGYISCHLEGNPPIGKIGLLGVHPDASGRKVGQTLVRGALDWFTLQGVELVIVVTQGRNYVAQRLYQKCGFLTQSVRLWYHKWYSV